MRKILSLVVIASFSLGGPVQAAWEKVSDSEIGDVFIDKSTLQLNGTNVRVMMLISPAEKAIDVRKTAPVSFLRQVEVICKTMQFKVLNGVSYTGVMAKGSIFSREEVGRFAKVVEGTPTAFVAQAACEAAPKKK